MTGAQSFDKLRMLRPCLCDMDKREFVSDIRAEREKLDAVLAQIQPADMLRPGVADEWSVKDVLAHLAMWGSRAVTLLFQAERGAKLQLPQSSASDWADVNASDYASQKDRPLERVLADYHGAHAQLLKRLEGWQDEAMLFDQRRFPQLKGSSLADVVWGDSGEHDAEHREQIETWLKSKP